MRHLLSVLVLSVLVLSAFSKPKADNAFPTESKFIYGVCISQHAKIVVCTDDRKLKAFDIETRKLLAEFNNGHINKILSVAMSPDSTLLVSGGRDSLVVIWDLNTQKVLQRLSFAKGKIGSLTFSPDSKFIAIGCSNSKAYIYSVADNKCIHELDNQQSDFTSVAFSKYGDLLAVAGSAKSINIYNTSDYSLAVQLQGKSKSIRALAFFNDRRGLLSCGDDGKVTQWNISSLKRIKSETISRKTGWSLCLDVENEGSNNFNVYAVGSSKGKVTVYSIFKNYFATVKSPVNQVRFVPRDDKYIELIVATLGNGLLKVNANDLRTSE